MVNYSRLKVLPKGYYAEIPLDKTENDRGHAPFKAFISLKNSGDMAFQLKNKLAHRQTFYNLLDIPPPTVFTLNQNHTMRIFAVKANNRPGDFYKKKADGLITSLGWPVLGVTVADCLPILLLSGDKKVYGLLHSGCKGTGIVEKGLNLFTREYRVKPASISVVMGPGIGSCCYRVDRERALAFAGRFGENTVQTRRGHFYIDLRQANINLLKKLGVKHITVIEDCTCCNKKLASFRRQGREGFTRMLVLFGSFKNQR